MQAVDYSEEAIPERDPSYELPCDYEGVNSSAITMSLDDSLEWERMVRERPLLRCLRG